MNKRHIGSEATDRIHAYLQAYCREQGPGTVQRIERALALADGYIRDRRRAGKLDVGVLVRICRELGIRPGKFLDDALGESEYAQQELPRARWKGAATIRRRFLEETGED